ncbi:hypothetical protein MKW94_002968 [Papaver nudicaule]|uniref:Uncharacterized protein n=1 Tax=Papaver nudicaule TaxID=74823 RepID=A0AA41VHN3_PAPNU|nr:hypothetical protein [Papaver nudicaule]
MKNEVKDIMYHLYKATKSSLRSIAPKEIKLLKHLLNITDPEERFSALATAFSPGDDKVAKDPDALYTYVAPLSELLEFNCVGSFYFASRYMDWLSIFLSLCIMILFGSVLRRSCTNGSRSCSTHTT